jgi:hypothetical protein
MSELRERLLEAADGAAREGCVPPAEAVVARGRRRRARLVGATAVLVVAAVVAGLAGIDRPANRPAPLSPVPTTRPTPTTAPPTTAPAQVWIPPVTPLTVRAHPGPYPGPDPGGIVRDVTSLVRGCHGTSRIRLWMRAQRMVWLVAAKPTPPGQARVCWAAGLMSQGGGGGLGTQQEKLKPIAVTFAGGDGDGRLGVVSGAVTRQAVRVRVLFRKGRPLELVPVPGGDGVPVNFFAGMFLGLGPPPAEHQRRESPIDRVIAFDRAGNPVAQCRMRMGLGNTC